MTTKLCFTVIVIGSQAWLCVASFAILDAVHEEAFSDRHTVSRLRGAKVRVMARKETERKREQNREGLTTRWNLEGNYAGLVEVAIGDALESWSSMLGRGRVD